MTELRSRFRGAMLGVLNGDSVGAEYENKHSDLVRADLKERGELLLRDYIEPWHGKRIVKAGQPTDDSELTAWLAESLVRLQGLDVAHVYANLRRFIHGRESFLTDGKAYGSGGTLRAALRELTYAQSFSSFRSGNVRVDPTNGSLMRGTPIALAYFGRTSTVNAAAFAAAQSCVTHIHPDAQVACIAQTLFLMRLLEGGTRELAWRLAKDGLESVLQAEKRSPDKVRAKSLRLVQDLNVSEPSEDEIWPHTGGALISLRIALWATLTAKDFVDGITKAIAVGGDTDTYAAIAGGFLGAHFGVEGIPRQWREKLQGADVMLDLADELYELSQE